MADAPGRPTSRRAARGTRRRRRPRSTRGRDGRGTPGSRRSGSTSTPTRRPASPGTRSARRPADGPRRGRSRRRAGRGWPARASTRAPPREPAVPFPSPGPRSPPSPIPLRGKAGPVCAGEGVGLEPRDVRDGPIRIQRRPLAGDPLVPVAVPVQRPVDVVLLLPVPGLVGPPLAALVAAALGERHPGAVGDRRAAEAEVAQLHAVARALVVVGEARRGGAQLALAARDRHQLQARVPAGRGRRRAAQRAVEAAQPRERDRLEHRLVVLVLVAHDELVEQPVARAQALGGGQRALAHLGHVVAGVGGTQERQVAAARARRLEGVVDLGEVAADHVLAAEAMHQPQVLEGGDVAQVPNQGTHERRVDLLQRAVVEQGDQGLSAVPRLLEGVGQRVGVGAGGGGEGHRCLARGPDSAQYVT